MKRLLFLGFFLSAFFSWDLLAKDSARSLLSPIKTDTPLETLRTFMGSMDTYKRAKEAKNEEGMKALDIAVQTLDLSHITPVMRRDMGESVAVYLKEVIDRLTKIHYDKLAERGWDKPDKLYYRVAGSEIKLVRINEGERKGQYLFSKVTVDRAKEFFLKVQHFPYRKGTGKGALYEDKWDSNLVPKFLTGKLFGLARWQWLGILLSIFIGLLVKLLALKGVFFFEKLTKLSSSGWDDRMVRAGREPFGWICASAFWFLSLSILGLEGVVLTIFSIVIQVIFGFSIIWLFYRLSDILTDYIRVLASKTDFVLDDQLAPMIQKGLRIFVVVFGGLIIVQNLGINVMSIVAGLGLGGLAFALAAKDTAANLFGSAMIFGDSPFKVGDWIKFDDIEGVVEEVGFRSTKIRTFYNSQVTIPNAVVANACIDNYGRREYRRVYSKLGVKYDTPPEKLDLFIEEIKKIILAHPYTRKDYFHVVFSNYGNSSLEIMLYFFLKVPDWSVELIEKQNIYMQILKLAKSMNVEFAFPTQTLHVESVPPGESGN